jgi:type I restriction enzyme S subunit
LTRLDNAVALLERVEQNLKRDRASVLKAAVEGRLVPTEAELARREGRTYEPASELLKRILAERKARWIEDAAEKARAKAEEKARKAGKPWTDKDNAATLDKERAKAAKQYEEPAAPDTTDLPDLPEGWCWTTLESIFASITDGDHVAPPQSPEGIPFLVIGDVRDGTIHLLGTRHVPREYYVQLDPARKPAVGDILYTVTGSFGIPVFVDSDVEFCVQRHIAILRPAPEVNARFLTKLLRSQPVFLQASDVATGTAQKTVGLQKLRAITVPLPPEAEQNRLLGELERAESLALSVGAAIVRATSRAVRLRQSILKWAFEGKLVKQDPSDEPASALLERIKATGPQSHLRRRES